MKKILNYDVFKNFYLNESNDEPDRLAYLKIKETFKYILSSLPFFADFLFSLRVAEARPGEGIETMATDGKSILYSANFVKQLSMEEVVFVFIHEIMHNANMHFSRGKGKNQKLWNVAGDFAINLQISNMIQEFKFENYIKTPQGILLDKKYEDMSAEQIYELLFKQLPPPQEGGDGDGPDGDGGPGGDGSGPGRPGKKGGKGGRPGEDGEEPTKPGTPGDDVKKAGDLDGKGRTIYNGSDELKDAKNDDEVEEIWGDIRIKAKTKIAGSGASSLWRWINKLTKPKVDWKSKLKKFVRDALDPKYDYRYYNKRFQYQKVYIPGIRLKEEGGAKHAVIAIDTSGSINDDTLSKFASELDHIFKTYKIKLCTVIWCDSDIPLKGVQTFNTSDKFEIKKLKPVGGGGTDFRPPFDYVERHFLKRGMIPSFFIYFTDAYGTFPRLNEYSIQRYNQRVLWVITDNDDARTPFGEVIYLDKEGVK